MTAVERATGPLDAPSRRRTIRVRPRRDGCGVARVPPHPGTSGCLQPRRDARRRGSWLARCVSIGSVPGFARVVGLRGSELPDTRPGRDGGRRPRSSRRVRTPCGRVRPRVRFSPAHTSRRRSASSGGWSATRGARRRHGSDTLGSDRSSISASCCCPGGPWRGPFVLVGGPDGPMPRRSPRSSWRPVASRSPAG